MFGVILWRDPTDRKAVIWCEDHGDLAFLNHMDDPLTPSEFFDVGDTVKFDLSINANVKQAHNVCIVSENTTHLRQQYAKDPIDVKATGSAQILPFRMADTKKHARNTLRPLQSQG